MGIRRAGVNGLLLEKKGRGKNGTETWGADTPMSVSGPRDGPTNFRPPLSVTPTGPPKGGPGS